MSKTTTLPSISTGDQSLVWYRREVAKFPMLDAEEEFTLARRWKDHQDRDAAHKLVTSHLRLVVRVAAGYRGYGLPMADLVAEGNIGLMQAVSRFDPDRGFRLTTYALWWIRAAIQEFVLRSWSLVKLGTTSSQRRLFFNLRRLRNRLQAIDADTGGNFLGPESSEIIAKELGVSSKDVRMMDERLSHRDASLNTPTSKNQDEGGEWQDWVQDTSPSQEEVMSEQSEADYRSELLSQAMDTLSEREQLIIRERRLTEKATTLEEMSHRLGISRERVRQIEVNAFEKLRRAVKKATLPDLATH